MVKKVFLFMVSLVVFEVCAFQAGSSSAKASGSMVDFAEDAATTGLLTRASVDYSALDDLEDLADQLAQLSVVTEAAKPRDGAIAPSPTSPKGAEILKAMAALVVTTKHKRLAVVLVQDDMMLRGKRQSEDEDFYQYGPLTPLTKRSSPFSFSNTCDGDNEKENGSGDSGSTDDSASEG